MSTEEQQEQASTYFVADRDHLEEMRRVEIQDKMLTASMGGALPELPDPTSLQHVLDVGCGTGCWLLELATTYPTVKQLIGVDISPKMVAYARAKAGGQGINQRVEFRTMNALQGLDFPTASFDLINQRAGGSWLHARDWPPILLEYLRLTRSGGIVRIVEPSLNLQSNSPALTKLWDLFRQAFANSGRLLTTRGDGIIDQLDPLMSEYGLQNIQTRTVTPIYLAGTEPGQHFYEDMLYLFRVLQPFFQQWADVPSDYEETCQQAKEEMKQPDFAALWPVFTAWGTKG